MIALFYAIVFIISVLCTTCYIFVWHKHFNINFTVIFTLIPISCFGYYLSSCATHLGEMVIALQITYLGGCFLPLFILLSILNLCQIEVRRWMRTALFILCALIYGTILTIGYGDLFYRSVTFDIQNGSVIMVKEYGPMHSVFYVLILLLFLTGLSAIFYSLLRKKQVPRTVLQLLILPEAVCVICFFLGRRIFPLVDFVPVGYVLAQLIYLLIAYRVNLYDISDTVIDSMVRDQRIGYLSFDFKYRYLGSDANALRLLPELSNKAVDSTLGYKASERRIRHYLESFQRDERNGTYLFTAQGETPEEDSYYNVNVSYLYDDTRRRGYIVTFTDDTPNRRYIRLLDTYNERLQAEVEEKTHHIVEMHDNLIMSLAMMVESRDNSTGGHIKRTSEGVRILIDEILKEGKLSLSQEFCADVIKAAPMHDLGKIAVDDAVLRKPGRFTDEEFERMKQHAAEGARVIHEILLHTDDESFKQVAENVAHYHHERWNGSGYPERLAGEQIPIEARIMAIADVYDALVSKRVYKEAFDFTKADSIIMEGMGTQFDPGLQSAYEKARPRLERYYSEL